VALDKPGCGLTERADPTRTPYNPYTVEGEASLILRLMKTLNISKAVFIGHSAGAYTALYIASKHPEAVEALVLIAPAWRMGEDGLQRFLLSLPLADKYGPLFLRAAAPYLEQILYKAWYNKNKLTQHVVDGYKISTQRPRLGQGAVLAHKVPEAGGDRPRQNHGTCLG